MNSETNPTRFLVRRLRRLFALTAGLIGLILPAAAQEAPESTVADVDDSEVIVLDPFIVSGDEDAGNYQATSTVGGSRVRMELKDLASPLSVITSQFLKDTGSNNNQDLLTYTTSTEIGGLYGNFGGFGANQGLSDRSKLLAPNENNRVRGLAQADNTRNFFRSSIPWDSYNTDRIEIQRGPNSILFGVGSPAGIINANTIIAKFGGNEGKIENQISSYNSLRWVGEYNVELVDDLLAIRVAGLFNDQKYRQEPAFNDDRRGFATATFQPQVLPSTWASKMTIRANIETAKIKANRPRILPPEDGISLWFEDYAGDGVNDTIGFGKRVYDMFLWSQTGGGDPGRGSIASATGVLNPLPYQPGVSALDGGDLNNGGLGFFFMNGDSRPYWVSRQAPRSFPGALNSSGGVDNAIGIPYGTMLRVGGYNSYSLAVDKIDEVEGDPSRFPLATRGYYKDQSLTDPTIFNFYDYLIDGDNKREFQEWDTSSISVSQTFFDNRLGVEFVYGTESYSEWREGSAWERPYISIDINKNLQNQLTQYSLVDHDNNAATPALLDTTSYDPYDIGAPNIGSPYPTPMAGAAFISGGFSGNNRTDQDWDNLRLTLFGELRGSDFFEKGSLLERFIGRHTFTGLMSREEHTRAVTEWEPSATTYEWALGLSNNGENTKLGESPRGITPIIYLSEPLFDRSSASGLNLGPIQTYYNPSGTYLVDYFDSTWLPSRNPADSTYVNPGAQWTDLLGSTGGVQADNPFNYAGRVSSPTNILNAANPADFDQLLTSYSGQRDIIDTVGAVWQGHFLNGLVVGTLGWRKDTIETLTGRADEDELGISSRHFEFEKVSEDDAETASWGVVAHMPDSWMENVPVLTGISAYYNYGENTVPQTRYNYDGSALANPSAESVDYGIVVEAFDKRLSIKVGHFKTEVKNANLEGGGSILGGNQYYLYQLEAWGTANALMYVFGREGLDPNQNWHWNWAWVDSGFPNDPVIRDDVDSSAFLNHPSTIAQTAAIDAWFAGMDAQFFTNYAIPADVPALQAAYATYKSSGNVQPLIAAAAASGFSVGTYTTGFSSQNNGQINGISPNGTIDNTSEGYEVEVNWNPTKNWRIQVNAAKTDAFRQGLGQPMLDFIDAQWAKLQGPAGDIRLWWGGDNTLRRYYSDNIIAAKLFQEEANGHQVPEMRPWRVGTVVNYTFTDGGLKGFNLGGAYRWQDGQILGYGLKDDESGLDVNKPIVGENEDAIDVWVGYERKVTKDINWRIQVNLRNVGDNVRLTPISVNPDGTVAAQRISEGMSWAVTNTFSF